MCSVLTSFPSGYDLIKGFSHLSLISSISFCLILETDSLSDPLALLAAILNLLFCRHHCSLVHVTGVFVFLIWHLCRYCSSALWTHNSECIHDDCRLFGCVSAVCPSIRLYGCGTMVRVSPTQTCIQWFLPFLCVVTELCTLKPKSLFEWEYDWSDSPTWRGDTFCAQYAYHMSLVVKQ